MNESEISILARLGSGSASRATHDGFVRFYRGVKEDGSDSFSKTIFRPDHWPEFRMVAVVTTLAAKKLSSRESGRQLIKNPLYAEWSAASHVRVDHAVEAVRIRSLEKLGKLMEEDWQELQHVLATCNPPIEYATETTFRVIAAIKMLRSQGIECYFTTDAG